MSGGEESLGYANPDYYTDATSSIERRLRADFATYHQLREIAPFGLTSADTAEMTSRADDLAARWTRHHSPHWRRMWQTLQSAVIGWEVRPDRARRNFDQIARARDAGDIAIDDDLWRSLRQARAITGHSAIPAGSQHDTHRHYPTLFADTTPAPAESATPRPDARTAVERTLGAPRATGASLATLEQVDAIIAATDAALDAEERRGDLDTGRDTRAALLPRAIREAPITYNYAELERWDLRQAALLREIQDLACEHSDIADHFDGTDDQTRIARLEALQRGLTAARRDALRAGIADADIERAYVLGRDGLYWSNEPSHPRLGRIAQLTEERDRARAQAAQYRRRSDRVATTRTADRTPGAGREVTARSDTTPEAGEQASGAGGGSITDAIDAVLADTGTDAWNPQPTAEPTSTVAQPHMDLLP